MLLSNLRYLCRSPCYVSSLDSTSLQLVCAMRDRGALNRVEELATLCSFMSNVMSWVSRNGISKKQDDTKKL
ncbi:hypothetical protein ACCO45_004565 [Purpureocillium lilacinum]|uniref:Uncharacterized protein n=1 Tax=Purpureocillium lilacinum TaxID=33203 RepID=A0ACC4DTW2_PURLI